MPTLCPIRQAWASAQSSPVMLSEGARPSRNTPALGDSLSDSREFLPTSYRFPTRRFFAIVILSAADRFALRGGLRNRRACPELAEGTLRLFTTKQLPRGVLPLFYIP